VGRPRLGPSRAGDVLRGAARSAPPPQGRAVSDGSAEHRLRRLLPALVATKALTLSWVTEALRRERQLRARERRNVEVAVLVGLLADRWCYQTARDDVNLEPLAALFALAAARALSRGRAQAALPWVALPALCSANGALAPDLCIRVTLLGVLAGIVRHPLVPLQELASKVPLVSELTAPVGLVGLASPWGFCMGLAVVVPSLLTRGSFMGLSAIFQVWPAVPFVAFGSAALLVAMVARRGVERLTAPAALLLTCGSSAAPLVTLVSGTLAGIRAQLPGGRVVARLASWSRSCGIRDRV